MEKEYEVMVVLKNASSEIVGKAQEAVESIFKEVGAAVRDAQNWGKRGLGYRVHDVTEGYYLLYQLTLVPDKVALLRKKLGSAEGIIRFLLTVKS